MPYETVETIANAAARPTPADGMIRYQQDIQSLIVYDSGATAWKIFTPDDAPYDIEGDGSNVLSVAPNFHFDASKINGTDATNNPGYGLGKAISGATAADPVVVTATSHGFSNDDIVSIGGVVGMTEINNRSYTVKSVTTHTFELYDTAGSPATVDGGAFTAWSSGGIAVLSDTWDASVVSGSGGVWTSRTNNVKTRIQATASAQPIYSAYGANGQPHFTLAADYLDLLEYNKHVIGTGALTHFGVCSKVTDTTGYATTGGYLTDQNPFSTTAPTDQVQTWANFSNGLEFMNWNDASVYDISENRASIDGSIATYAPKDGVPGASLARMFIYTRDGSNNNYIYVDGDNRNTSLGGNADKHHMIWDVLFSAGFGSGSKWSATGDYYEIAFWDSLLSDADLNKLITYVNAKYGVGRNADDDGTFARVTF